MKLSDVYEARYHGIHPVVDFINDVRNDESRSKEYPADQYSAIFKSITDEWGKPRSSTVNYAYWRRVDDEILNILLMRKPNDTVMVEVSKG